MTGRIVDSFPQTKNLPTRAIRLGLKAHIFSGGTPDKSNMDFWEGGELPWIGSGEVNQRHITVPTAYINDEAVRNSATKLFPLGSVAMALAGQGKTKATVATMGVGAYGNQSLACISDYDGDGKFLFWWLSSLYREIRGLSSQDTRDGLNQSMVGQIPVPDYDLDTQKAIADFLDRETARIDQLIEKKLRLSNLLEEKLTDDILRAVTLGLEPDVELTPEDDLEWTSHRPKHWRMVRLKYLFRENTQYSSDGTETLLSLRMNDGLVPHNDVSDKELLPDDLIGYKKVFPGQIVMNRMRAAIGLFGLANSEGIVSPDYSIFDVNREAHAGYFLRLFKTEPMKAAFRLLSKGLGTGHSGFMRLNSDNFGRIRVAVPDFEEQVEISRYVEARIQQVNALGNKNKASIDRLKEFRSALITAAVTGQIDVETWGKQRQTDRRLDQIEEEMSRREACA